MAQYGNATPQRRGGSYSQYGIQVNPYLNQQQQPPLPSPQGATRDLLRGRIGIDPESYLTATTTPGEQAAMIAQRTASLPARRASSELQDRGSPLAGRAAAFDAIMQRDAAAKAEADRQHRARIAAHQQLRAANNQRITERLQPGFQGPVQPNDARAQAVRDNTASLSAKYANYLRGVRGSGNALSFNDFANAYAYDGGRVPDDTRKFLGLNADDGRAALVRAEITPADALAANRREVASRIAEREAATDQLHRDRRNVAQFRMFGIMPSDPSDAQRMMSGMAAMGNRGAGDYMSRLMQETGLNNRAALLAGSQDYGNMLNYLGSQAQLAQARRPTPESQMNLAAQLFSMRPTQVRREAYNAEIERQRQAMGDQFNPLTAELDATRLANQAEAEARATMSMLSQIPELAPFIGSMSEPTANQAAMPGSSAPAGTPVTAGVPVMPPSATPTSVNPDRPIARPPIGGQTTAKPEMNPVDAAKWIRDYTAANGKPPSPEEFKATFGHQFSLDNIGALYHPDSTRGAWFFPNQAQNEQANMARDWLNQNAEYFGISPYREPERPPMLSLPYY